MWDNEKDFKYLLALLNNIADLDIQQYFRFVDNSGVDTFPEGSPYELKLSYEIQFGITPGMVEERLLQLVDEEEFWGAMGCHIVVFDAPLTFSLCGEFYEAHRIVEVIEKKFEAGTLKGKQSWPA